MLWWSLMLPIVGWATLTVAGVLYIVKTVVDLFIPEPQEVSHDPR